jgi:hypothetical protein
VGRVFIQKSIVTFKNFCLPYLVDFAFLLNKAFFFFFMFFIALKEEKKVFRVFTNKKKVVFYFFFFLCFCKQSNKKENSARSNVSDNAVNLNYDNIILNNLTQK